MYDRIKEDDLSFHYWLNICLLSLLNTYEQVQVRGQGKGDYSSAHSIIVFQVKHRRHKKMNQNHALKTTSLIVICLFL